MPSTSKCNRISRVADEEEEEEIVAVSSDADESESESEVGSGAEEEDDDYVGESSDAAGGSGSGSGDGGESVGAWPYDESAARDELVTLIVSQDLPVGIDYHTWVTTTSARPPLWQNNLIFETTFIF